MSLIVKTLRDTLAKLPDNAELRSDEDAQKFDVYIEGEWEGGIWWAGEYPGEFYEATPTLKAYAACQGLAQERYPTKTS